VGLVPSQVLINEVDYDDAGIDDLEFIELINLGGTAVDLGAGGYEIVLLNGNASPVPTEYDRVDLTGSIPANGYYVVAANDPNSTVTGADQGGVGASDGFGSVQNGAGDLVALVTVSGSTDTLVDALAYEGTPANPQQTANGLDIDFSVSPITTPFSGADAGSDTDSVSRQVGANTGVNDDDFVVTGRTPGAANGAGAIATPINISDFRALSTSDTNLYEITAVATTVGNAFVPFRTHFYLQDSSGTDGQSGVLIDSSGPIGDSTLIQPGDSVTVEGRRSEFEGEVEMSATSVVINSTGAQPAPLVITPADLTVANTPNIAGELVVIEGVTDPSSATAQFNYADVGDGDGLHVLATAAVGASTFPLLLDASEIDEPLRFPDAPWDLTGIVAVDDVEITEDATGLSAGQGLLAPRDVFDIFEVTPVTNYELYR
jgi:hypothetical protein